MARRIGEWIVCRLLSAYIKLLEKTVTWKWISPEAFTHDHIVGFWHGDSLAATLLLRHMARRDPHISVIVTRDTRGNYIEYLVQKNGGQALRVEDGPASRSYMKMLLQTAQRPGTIASAMDGPLGPRHVPKSLSFYLAQTGKKEFVRVQFTYSHAVYLRSRWDHYAIILPFTTITATFENYGFVDKRHIPPWDATERT